jgi:uncharacterized protein YndB with AHSA1/START domain
MDLIMVSSIVNAPINKIWQYWNQPVHVVEWNFASDDWYCPKADNHLIIKGEFHYTVASKDDSVSFDFWGTYTKIEFEKLIEILLGDGRAMTVCFEELSEGTKVTESFEPESENSLSLQKMGWQSILDNFKKYAESKEN